MPGHAAVPAQPGPRPACRDHQPGRARCNTLVSRATSRRRITLIPHRNNIVGPRAAGIKALINEVFDKLPSNFTSKLLEYVDKDEDAILSRFPEDYGQEIKGIAQAIGMDVGLVVIYNIFYEVSSLCTSIVAQDTQGNVYHARNLDFGLFLGWDKSNQTWYVTEVRKCH